VVRIGIVDLDTPHAGLLAGLLNRHDDLRVTAVWDGRAVHPPGYAGRFAAENGIEHACESLEEMIDLVDLALVLGVDWDFHLMRSEPFLEAGKMVYIDSPAVGKTAHCARLLEWQEKGASIMVGGAARFCSEVEKMRAEIGGFGEIVSIFAAAPPHFFARGIDVVEIVGALIGPGALGVSYISSKGDTSVFFVDYDGGPVCMIQLASPGHDLCISICGQKKSATVSIGRTDLSGLAEAVASFARTGRPPIELKHGLEAVRVMIAAGCALGHRDRVYIHNLDRCAGFDGWEYADSYALAARSRS